MKKIILYSLMEMMDDGGFVRLHTLSQKYGGLWAEMKKGREIVEQNAKADQATAKQNRANSQDQFNKVGNIENEETASTTPGSLSPAATAQLASDRDQIANTYNGIRQTAFRTLGQRGMGSAPSGFAQTASNAADLGEATQGTAAYRNAQVQTEQQRQHAANLEAGLTGTEGSLGNQASGESTTAAVDRSKMGSTFGDIMGGIAQVAPIVAAPFTGGASLAGSSIFGGTNPFSKLGKGGSNIGTYGGGSGGGACCWVATELYGGRYVPQTVAIFSWLEKTWWMKPFLSVYRKIGPKWAEVIRHNQTLRRPTKRLFDWFLKQACEAANRELRLADVYTT